MTDHDALTISREVFPRGADTSRAELKAAHASPPAARGGLDPQQVKTLAIDQVRLAQLAQLRDDPGEHAVALRRIAERRSTRVAAISGAGISVDAGFPTFRGSEGEGLWEQVDPMVLASIDGYRENPMRTMRWYCSRRAVGLPAVPTLAHATIAAAQQHAGDAFGGVHTQNIDGLHEAAGSRGVNRIHGSIYVWKDPRTMALVWGPSADIDEMPRHPDGRPSVRPGVVMFGDFAPTRVYERAIGEILRCDVALIVGTSAQVSTLWPLLHAARSGGSLLIEINPEASDVTNDLGAIHLRLPSGSGVPLALETLGALSPDQTARLASTPREPLSAVLPTLREELMSDR